jgi:8-oxo-dGTP pyrophosphatase MutT (NUDIX family)
VADMGESEPLATGPRGMALLEWVPAGRGGEGAHFADAPVGYVLVVLRCGERVLRVYVTERGCWELPGGGIEPGETPRQAAARELREESGQVVAPARLRFEGFARTALGPQQRVRYGAVFSAECTETGPAFTPNEEVSRVHWRRGGEPLPGGGEVQTVDDCLVELCGRGGRGADPLG